MTTRSARRLSARTAAAALIGVTTCCAYLALSGGVAKGDTTGTTSTGAPTTVTTIDETFGPAGSVDPAPTTTTAPPTTSTAPPTTSTAPTTTTAPPTTGAPTTTVPPTTTPVPTTTIPDIFAPVEVIPLPVPTTVVIPTTVPSPVTSLPSNASPVPTLPTATTQPSTAGSLPRSPLPATTIDNARTAIPGITSTTVTTAVRAGVGVRAEPITTTVNAPSPEAPAAGSATETTSASVIGSTYQAALDSSGPMLQPFTVELPLPGSDSSISIEVRPSRLAAAWLLWVTVSLLVVAFWLPSPARRLATSSVPQRHRR